jgi:hypothetical protein
MRRGKQMKFTTKPPTKPGFYWCVPKFYGIASLENYATTFDDFRPEGCVSVVYVSGYFGKLLARFIGNKFPFEIGSDLLKDTLWGDEVKSPRAEEKSDAKEKTKAKA